MEAGLELGDDPVSGEIAVLLLVDALGHEEHAAQAVALAQSPLGRPRNHRLVAHVLVDPPASGEDGLGDVVEEVVLEVVEPQRPEPRSKRA